MSIRSCGAVSGGIRNPWSRGVSVGAVAVMTSDGTHRSLPRPVPVVGARRRGSPAVSCFGFRRSEASAIACTSTKANEVIVTYSE